jgi:hypothetical protein
VWHWCTTCCHSNQFSYSNHPPPPPPQQHCALLQLARSGHCLDHLRTLRQHYTCSMNIYCGGSTVSITQLCTFTVVAAQCPSHSYAHLLWWQYSVHHTVMHIYCGGSTASITQLCTFTVVAVQCPSHSYAQSITVLVIRLSLLWITLFQFSDSPLCSEVWHWKSCKLPHSLKCKTSFFLKFSA